MKNENLKRTLSILTIIIMYAAWYGIIFVSVNYILQIHFMLSVMSIFIGFTILIFIITYVLSCIDSI